MITPTVTHPNGGVPTFYTIEGLRSSGSKDRSTESDTSNFGCSGRANLYESGDVLQKELIAKPWGMEEIWARTAAYVGKFLHINAGAALSRQYHTIKEETLCVLSGVVRLELGERGEDVRLMTVGCVYHVKPTEIHRLIAVSRSVVCEVSTPELDDVVRLEDDYGRAQKEER